MAAAINEIASFCALFVILTALPVVWVASVRARPEEAVAWVADAGTTAVVHAGSMFGAVIPTLLGMTAIVIGGQFTGQRLSGRVRRWMTGMAEFLVGLLSPALALMICAALVRPDLWGAVLISVPAFVAAAVLAVQLGCYFVAEDDERVETAIRARDRYDARLSALQSRSGGVAWRVLMLVATISSASSIAVTALAHGTVSATDVAWLSGWNMASASSAVLGSFLLLRAHSIGDRWTDGIAWWMFGASLTAPAVLTPVFVLMSQTAASSFALGGAVLVLIVMASTLVPWRPDGRARWWSIRAAAATSAFRSVQRARDAAAAEIESVRPRSLVVTGAQIR